MADHKFLIWITLVHNFKNRHGCLLIIPIINFIMGFKVHNNEKISPKKVLLSSFPKRPLLGPTLSVYLFKIALKFTPSFKNLKFKNLKLDPSFSEHLKCHIFQSIHPWLLPSSVSTQVMKCQGWRAIFIYFWSVSLWEAWSHDHFPPKPTNQWDLRSRYAFHQSSSGS